MKTKITLLLLSVCFMMASCSKLPYGDGHHDDDKIVLTENNYVYEGDLYKYALSLEIDSLQQREKDLIGKVGQDPKLQEELDRTSALLKETISVENNVHGFADILDLVGRRGPRPPRPPRPGVLPEDFRYILRYDLESLSVLGFNQDSKLVIESEEGYLSPLPRTKRLLQIQEISKLDAEPEDFVTLKIKRTNNAGKVAEYTIDAKVRK